MNSKTLEETILTKRRFLLMGGNTMEEVYVCCVCGEEHSVDDMRHIETKGQTKKICKECLDSIHGLA